MSTKTTTFRLDRVLSDRLVGLTRMGDGEFDQRSLWSQVRLIKAHRCAATGKELRPGMLAFRPVNDGMNRYERIDAEIVAHWIDLFAELSGQPEPFDVIAEIVVDI